MKRHKIKVIREVHDTPQWANELLERAFGRNRYGQPNFRAIWSENRLAWIGGQISDFDENGLLIRTRVALRQEPKYEISVRNRWVIEKWYPPEHFGSPEAWYKQTKEFGEEGNIPQLGPYPFRGDYDFCTALEDDGQFAQISVDMVELAIVLIRQELAKHRTIAERKSAKEEQHRLDAKQGHEYLNETTKPSFNDGMFVSVA